MKIEDFRERMWAYRQSADRDANNRKASNLAWESLRDLYRRFDSDERNLADQVLAEWALSDDENIRYDALVLIGDFRIMSARWALDNLSVRLKQSKAPGAPFELKKVESILRDFRASS